MAMFDKIILKLKHICLPILLALAMNMLVAAEGLGAPSLGAILPVLQQGPAPTIIPFVLRTSDITQNHHPFIIHDDIWLADGAASFQQRHLHITA